MANMERDLVIGELYKNTKWNKLEEEFVKEAKKLRTTKQVAEFSAKWSFYLYYNTSDSSLKSRSLVMRKALEKAGIDKSNVAYTILSLPSGFYKLLNQESSKKVIEKLEDKEVRELDNIDYAVETEKLIDFLVNKINTISDKDVGNNTTVEKQQAYLKLFVIALATGRRQVEILKTLTINKKGEMAVYSGLAKKKKSDSDKITAPILYDISVIKSYLKDVRKEFDTENMDNRKINQKYSGIINKAFEKYITSNEDFEWLKGKGVHFLRAMYAETCYAKFGENSDKETYMAKVLGHEVKLSAVKNYQAKIRG